LGVFGESGDATAGASGRVTFMSHPASKRIPSLDGLRALSIGLVLLGHLAGTRHFLSHEAVARFGDLGNLGVRMFFVISGFLITQLLLAELAKTRTISLKAFYIRRTLRILPAFYVFILAASALALMGLVVVDRSDLLHAVTYTMNYHVTDNFTLRHLWSLSVEEQFYLVWPLALAVLGVARAPWVLGAVLAIVPVLRIGLFHFYPGYELYINTAFESVCDALATGCLLAILLPRLSTSDFFPKLISSRLFPLLIVALFVANRQTNHPALFWFACIPFMNVTMALIVARYVQFPELIGGRALNSTPLVGVGVLSYSLYLWQELFLIQGRPAHSILLAFPLNVILAFLLAGLSYALIEQPFLRLKDRFEPSRSPRGAGSRRVSTALT
jgi:peptidoglycan/LPS O-acetylase OafA/YrhL